MMENRAVKDKDGVPALVLASGSPRRRELLAMFGLPFAVLPARGAEIPPPGLGPGETAEALARAKAEEVRVLCAPDAVVIAADTVVELDGGLLGKPKDGADAARMLRALSGREHRVFSGVCVCRGGRLLLGHEETAVRFRPLAEAEIAAYVRSGEPLDKAGAYGAQGLASLFVEGIRGDFFNVMGLPLCRLGQMLKELGVELL